MKKQNAFSLIELSIVILIIGIIIAGVTQASRLVTQMRLTAAKTQTQSSPVAGIKNLVSWFEATSDKSFDDVETFDGSTITNWYDINPQSVQKNNAASSGTNRPIYKAGCINNLPCLNFVTANSNYIDTSQTLGTPTQVTIFAVASFRSFPSSGCCYGFVMTNGAFLATSMHLNVYNTNNQFNYVVSPGANIFSGNNSIALNQNYVFDFVDDNTAVNFYFNGINTASIAVSYGAKNLGILNIGSWNDTASSRGRFFDGYISEIIIFDRALKTEERRSIEAYLGKKWGIKVS